MVLKISLVLDYSLLFEYGISRQFEKKNIADVFGLRSTYIAHYFACISTMPLNGKRAETATLQLTLILAQLIFGALNKHFKTPAV